MNAFTLLAVAQGDGQVAQIARTFGVDWPHLVAQIISFSIVCAVLYKFAYKRILAMLELRREQIRQGIANAEKIKAELDKTETQRQEVLAQAHAQAPHSSRKLDLRLPVCSKRKPKKRLPLPNRSWPRRAKPLRRTTTKCSLNSNARLASWWWRLRLRSPAKF